MSTLVLTLVGRRFARQRFADSRGSIRKKIPILEALGQIRADRVFSPIRWGWGFAQVWRRFILCSFLWLPSSRQTECSNQFFLRRYLMRRFLRSFLVRRFLRPFQAQIFGGFLRRFLRRFSADFSSTFWRLKNRCSRVTQKCAEICGKICGVRMALLGGVPHSISAFSSRQHVTQSPLGQHTQGEHVSVHRDIFGPKGMLAFAPRFFKNKNLRKMSSAKPQPQRPIRKKSFFLRSENRFA